MTGLQGQDAWLCEWRLVFCHIALLLRKLSGWVQFMSCLFWGGGKGNQLSSNNSHTIPAEELPPSSSFYRWGNGGLERLDYLPKATQLGSCRVRIRTDVEFESPHSFQMTVPEFWVLPAKGKGQSGKWMGIEVLEKWSMYHGSYKWVLEQANVLLASVFKVFLKVLIVRLALAAKSCDQRERKTGSWRHLKVDKWFQSTVSAGADFPVPGLQSVQ